MQKKYLAYLVLLAGWIGFCYWLYAEELLPRLQGIDDRSYPARVRDLKLPLAFNWGSAKPLAGEGYKEWLDDIEKVDSLRDILIIKGYYFRDEQGSIPLDEVLAHQRVDSFLKVTGLPLDKVLVQVLPREINADVRSSPFEAIELERIALNNVLRLSGDTIELCFPLKDSFNLPPLLLKRLDAWLDKHSGQQEDQYAIIGIADGSGIAESSDQGLDRAIWFHKLLKEKGWTNEHIRLSSGQRTNPNPIRNRCIIMFKE